VGATRETGGVGCWAFGLTCFAGFFPFDGVGSGCDCDVEGSEGSKDPGRDVVGVNGVSFDRVHSRDALVKDLGDFFFFRWFGNEVDFSVVSVDPVLMTIGPTDKSVVKGSF
jgi:hypothetical protein